MVVIGFILVGVFFGCGFMIFVDLDGIFDFVFGGELCVGILLDGDLVEVICGDLMGIVVDFVDVFVDSIDVELMWMVVLEEMFVWMLEVGDFDFVVGGIMFDILWIDKVGVIRGYLGIEGVDG